MKTTKSVNTVYKLYAHQVFQGGGETYKLMDSIFSPHLPLLFVALTKSLYEPPSKLVKEATFLLPISIQLSS